MGDTKLGQYDITGGELFAKNIFLNGGFTQDGVNSAVSVSDTLTIKVGMEYLLVNGTLIAKHKDGPGKVTVSPSPDATFILDGELQGPVQNGGNMQFNLQTSETTTLNGAAVDNSGISTLQGMGTLMLTNGSVFNNQAGGVVNIAGDGAISGDPGSSFLNAGTLRKSTGTGISVIGSGIAFSNPNGTIDVQTGTICLDSAFTLAAGQSLSKTGAGTFDITSGFTVAGAVTQSAGTLSTASSVIYGTYTQTGGLHTSAAAYTWLLGAAPGAQAVYNLSGGEFRPANILYLGSGNSARFVQTGGMVSLNSLYVMGESIPYDTGNTIYEMHAGTLGGTGQLLLGRADTAAFNQSGGDVSFAWRMIVGFGSRVGTYDISAGTSSTGDLAIGQDGGTGVFTQTGGAVTAPGTFVGLAGGGPGTYTISGGTLASRGWMTSIGHGGAGTLNISGTAAVTTDDLYAGNGDAGIAGAGAINQSGGAITVNGTLRGAHNGASGAYNLSGGTLTVAAAAPGPVVNNGTINQTGGTATFGDFSGAGVVAVAGTGSLTANHVRQDSLTVNNTALVSIRPTSCGYGPGLDGGTSVVKHLTMGRDVSGNPTGKIDIANNHLIVDWSAVGRTNPIDEVTSMLKSAYNTGAWDGTGLGTSKFTWTQNTAVGAADNSVGTARTIFGGQAVPSHSTLVRYTLAGDSDLDATVGFSDLTAVSQNYGAAGTFHWYQGDFNYDGHVDFSDMTKVSQNYGQTLTCPEGGGQNSIMGGGESPLTLTGMDEDAVARVTQELSVIDTLRDKIAAQNPEYLADFDAFVSQWWGGGAGAVELFSSASSAQAAALSVSAVPEPAALSVLALAGAILTGRRRRSRTDHA